MKFDCSAFIFIRMLVIFSSLYAGFSVAQPAKTIELYALNYPPYMIVDKQGGISGIDVEVTQSAFAAVGVPVKMETAPWKRILKSLEFGYIAGAITCSYRTERERFVWYSDKVSEANQVAVFKKGADVSGLINFDDLRNYKVMAAEGWAIQKELEKSSIVHETTLEMDNGIKSVAFRDVDVFYNGELATLFRAKQLSLLDKIDTKRFLDKKSSTFHLCLSKGYSDSKNLISKFNEGLKLIKNSGEYDSIYSKYLSQ